MVQAVACSPGSAYGRSTPRCRTSHGFSLGVQVDASGIGYGTELVGTAAVEAAPGAAAAAAASEAAEEMDAGFSGCEFMVDASSDMSEPWIDDSEAVETDVITSAFANWCAHKAATEAGDDPLASFFAQLVSSHSLTAGGIGKDVEPPDLHVSPGCTYSPSPRSGAECLGVDAPEFSADVTPKTEGAAEVQRQPTSETLRADSGSRRMHTPYAGRTVADTIGAELRAHFTASLRRSDFPHILGSLRAAILSSPEVFGFYDVDGPSEAEAAPGKPIVSPSPASSGACLSDGKARCAGAELQQQQRLQQLSSDSSRLQLRKPQSSDVAAVAQGAEAGGKRADGFCFFGENDGSEWLLPPTVPVSCEFCRVNPRVAVRWLVQTQVESMLANGHPHQQLVHQQRHRVIGERPSARLEGTSWAQLACLAPPKALCSKPAAVVNPAREEMQLAAARLAKGLNREQAHALEYLLQAWYFSGYFAGQMDMAGSSG